MAKIVTLINTKDRSYNGVKKGETITVDAAEAIIYQAEGFKLIETTEAEDEGGDAPKALTKKEAEATVKTLKTCTTVAEYTEALAKYSDVTKADERVAKAIIEMNEVLGVKAEDEGGDAPKA